jgi:RHS repeat-associated protein
MTLMTYPSGKRVKVGSDARGRLAAIQRVDASGNPQETYLSGINYRADGLISSQNLGNGATESFGYSDDLLQLTSQTVTKGSNTLLSLSYGYGAGAGQMGSGTTSGNSGQLVSVSGTINGQGRNQAFTYDNVGRLVTATGWGAWARRFDYDRYGNRTAVWDAVSGGNQLQNTALEQVGGIKTNRIASVNGTAFNYDASGNVTGDGARAYTYDAENRIVSVGGLSSESYAYDAGNRRVKKEVGGVVTHYVWGGNKVIAEYERGGGGTQATGTRYYHQDRLSTRVITDGAGAVVGTTDQLPFGEEIGVSGEGEKHKFTTYERDGALDYAVNRHYDPQRGRFNQVDPLGMGAVSLVDPQSLNLYSYVRNDPVNSVDPSGLNDRPASIDNKGGIHCSAQYSGEECGGLSGLRSGNYGDHVAEYNRVYGGMSEEAAEALGMHLERVANAFAGQGYRTNEQISREGTFPIIITIYKDGKKIVRIETRFNINITVRAGPPTAEDYILAIRMRANGTEGLIWGTIGLGVAGGVVAGGVVALPAIAAGGSGGIISVSPWALANIGRFATQMFTRAAQLARGTASLEAARKALSEALWQVDKFKQIHNIGTYSNPIWGALESRIGLADIGGTIFIVQTNASGQIVNIYGSLNSLLK